LSHLRLPQPGRPGSRIYIPQEQGGPVIPPGTGLVPLLKLKFIYDRQSVGQSVMVSGTCDQFFFLFEISFRQLCVSYFVAPSLTRGWVCNLLYNCFWALPEQSLLGRSPAELLTTFYCLIWDSPNLESQVPIFISPRNRMAQLYPRALGYSIIRIRVRVTLQLTVCLGVEPSLGLLTRDLTSLFFFCVFLKVTVLAVRVRVTLQLTVSQSVSMSWCWAQFGTFDQRIFFFFFKVTVFSYLGCPLWREVGSVICHYSL
jgi:hypothetical protein